MKKTYLYLGISIISLFLCTGCFDLEEYLFLNKDGSGKFAFVIDMSKMMAMAEMYEDSTQTQKKSNEEEQLSSSFERSRRKIIKVPGISNYQTISDTVNYRFGFSFEFSDMQSLNKALNFAFESDSVSVETNYTYFEFKNKQLIRKEPTDVRNLVNGQSKAPAGKATEKNKLFNFDMVFADVTYSSTYEFEQAIDSVSNENCLLSPKGNKVLLTCHPFAMDSASQACTLKNQIFLK